MHGYKWQYYDMVMSLVVVSVALVVCTVAVVHAPAHVREHVRERGNLGSSPPIQRRPTSRSTSRSTSSSTSSYHSAKSATATTANAPKSTELGRPSSASSQARNKMKLGSAGFSYDLAFSMVAIVVSVLTLRVLACAETKLERPNETKLERPNEKLERPNEQNKNPPNWATVAASLCLVLLFALWYFFNIYFNIYNKMVLKAMSVPFSMTLLQFFIGSLIAGGIWATGVHPFYRLSRKEAIKLIPLAALHTLGNLFTNLSLNAVAVSFTHTIKASEPFFAVIMSWIFLNTPPTLLICGSLVPVVGGVTLASMTEATFNWIGLSSALASNLTFQTRNVVSKKIMKKQQPITALPNEKVSGDDAGSGATAGHAPTLDNINLFSYITVFSFCLLLPVSLLVEGLPFLPSMMAQNYPQLNHLEILSKAAFAGFFFHAYQQISFCILERVTPVTHAVGNCVKRVAVIVVSIIIFSNPVGLLNAIGIAIAMGGVLVYSVAKKLEAKWAKDSVDMICKLARKLSGNFQDLENNNNQQKQGEYLPLSIGHKIVYSG